MSLSNQAIASSNSTPNQAHWSNPCWAKPCWAKPCWTILLHATLEPCRTKFYNDKHTVECRSRIKLSLALTQHLAKPTGPSRVGPSRVGLYYYTLRWNHVGQNSTMTGTLWNVPLESLAQTQHLARPSGPSRVWTILLHATLEPCYYSPVNWRRNRKALTQNDRLSIAVGVARF